MCERSTDGCHVDDGDFRLVGGVGDDEVGLVKWSPNS